MKITISVGRCLIRETMLVRVKENKTFATYINLCNLQELYAAFKPKCKYWVLKVLCLKTQMVCSGWFKCHSLCLRLQRSSKCSVASRCNRLGLDIQRPVQINFALP